MNRILTALAFFSFLSTPALFAAEPATNASPEVIRGPFFSGTVRGKNDQAIAMKGIVVTVGPDKKAWVCYDTDLMRVSLSWTGDFLEFGNTLNQIAWPPPPQVKGNPLFGLSSGPGWGHRGTITDPRSNAQGSLPKSWAHYEGLYQNGETIVLNYTVGGKSVLESPAFFNVAGRSVFARTIQFSKRSSDEMMVVADGLTPNQSLISGNGNAVKKWALKDGKALFTSLQSPPEGSRFECNGSGQLILRLPRIAAHHPFRIYLAGEEFVAPSEKIENLKAHLKGGPALWNDIVETKGVKGVAKDGYVVDTLTEPLENPYFSKTFFGGFDFFKDGRAAICTFHGAVKIVSGIDDSLDRLKWKRFATGLFQPLGLKIVKEQIYVLGRDQITRLHDLNKDQEADYFENFNNDTVVTPNYHEFSLDLHTDKEGNFYFAKGSPWQPAVTSPHQGCLFKVSADGSRLEVIATGLRAPNGMAVGPRGEITVSDNQGHWIPSSKLNWVEPGGFYGMTPAAQKSLVMSRDATNFTANPSIPLERKRFGFTGWDTNSPIPLSYDKPCIWVPMYADNSSGGQLWATSDQWGPLNNSLLFMSYGKCTLFSVMMDKVDGVRQGAMYQLPLKFRSGLMRGRIHPKDGQVYLSGLKGWQSSATRDGGFYRVRYTGAESLLPTGFHAQDGGVELTFNLPLDATAADPGNFSVEAWNYLYSGGYGSPEFSVANPKEKKHDSIEVVTARLDSTRRKLYIKFKEPVIADQVRIRYSLPLAGGSNISQEIFGTIYRYATSSTSTKTEAPQKVVKN